MRVGPSTQPDYGLVVGRTKACAVEQGESGVWKFTSGESTLEILSTPLRFRLLHRGAPVVGSITDEHFRGCTRLPAFGRVRQGGHWTASLALASGEPVYGLGEKFGPLNKRGQLIHSRVVDALGVNTGLAYKNAPFAWSPGTGKGAWGLLRPHAGVGDARRRTSRLVAPLVRDRRRRRGARLFLFAADTPAGILDLYTQLTGRAAPVPLWSLGLWVSRAYYKTPEEAAAVAAKLRAPPDPVRRADARRPRRVEGRNARRFRMGSPTAFRIRARRSPRSRPTTCGSASGNIPMCRCIRRSFADLGVARLPPDHEGRRSLRVRLGHGAGHEPVRQGADAVARERHRRLHASRRLRVVARCARRALRRRRRRDQERFRRAGPRRRRRVQRRQRPPAAQRLSAALQPMRVRGDGEIPARARFGADGLGPRRLDRQPALSYPVGRRSAKRLGRPCRIDPRGPFVGHERRAVPQLRHRRLLRLAATVGGALSPLAAGDGVQLAHPRPRHRRARTLGVRRRGRSHSQEVARVPLPA